MATLAANLQRQLLLSKLLQKFKRDIAVSLQPLVTVIGVNDDLLFTSHLVEGGKLCRGRAGGIHKTRTHHDLRLDAGREELNVDIAELLEDLILSLVSGVEMTEVIF